MDKAIGYDRIQRMMFKLHTTDENVAVERIKEEERQIMSWRNAQYKHVRFSSQNAYDKQRAQITSIKERLLNGDINEAIATQMLLNLGYGPARAKQLAAQWNQKEVVSKWR